MLVTLSAAGDAKGEVERRIEAALGRLSEDLGAVGFEVEEDRGDTTPWP
jgi:hypothetical protein